MHNNDILKLNHDFYELNAKSFSLTRQSAWYGWFKALEYIKTINNPRVLDVGCGNGRFYEFLSKQLGEEGFEYSGIDFSSSLIKEAKTKYGDALFSVQNFLELDNLPAETFDVIVGFGIMHHIDQTRESFINNLSLKIKHDGLLILTFWVRTPEPKSIAKDLGENNFLLKWENKTDTTRYVHVFTEGEAQNLIDQSGLNTLFRYYDDGKDKKSNLYIVAKKL